VASCTRMAYTENMGSSLHAVSEDESETRAKAPARQLLVVDDNDSHRADVREVLLDEGYEVVEAGDGKAALEYLVSRRGGVPDCIVLDLSMPVMTGWELLAVLKSYVRFKDIPVILLSGVEPRLDPVRHGVIAAFLRKPYDADALLAAVGRALGPAASTSSSTSDP
jgi:CheY-like chemotaxis protein